MQEGAIIAHRLVVGESGFPFQVNFANWPPSGSPRVRYTDPRKDQSRTVATEESPRAATTIRTIQRRVVIRGSRPTGADDPPGFDTLPEQ